MIKPVYVAIFLLITLAATNAPPVSTGLCSRFHGQPTGRIQGTVVDPNGALILNAVVIIKGRQTIRRLTTNLDGAYEAELPPGIYEISTEISGWYAVRRARFRLLPGMTITITLAPPLRVSSVALEVTTSGISEPVTTLPPPKYDSFLLPPLASAQLDLVIRFVRKRTRRGFVKYDGGTIATYNALTLSATKLRLDRRTFRIEAEGNVIVEDGKDRTHAKGAVVEFKEGEPIVKITQ